MTTDQALEIMHEYRNDGSHEVTIRQALESEAALTADNAALRETLSDGVERSVKGLGRDYPFTPGTWVWAARQALESHSLGADLLKRHAEELSRLTDLVRNANTVGLALNAENVALRQRAESAEALVLELQEKAARSG